MFNIHNRFSDLIADRQIIPFLGAGFSIPSGLPTWKKLVEGLIRNVASDHQQTLLKQIQSEMGEADLSEILDSFSATEFSIKEYLLEQINSVRYEPSDYHRLLLDLNCNTIITTNWDRLIEEELAKNHIAYQVIYQDAEVSYYDPDRAVQVIKIHGTISDARSLVYKKSDYERFWQDRPLLMNLVCTLMATKSFLFMGYGFGDPNILFLLDILHSKLGKLRREHYTLTFNQGLLSTTFKQKGIHIIDGSTQEEPSLSYENITKQFLTNLTNNSRSFSLSNLERSRLVNSEIERLIKRMPPKPMLRMRGALGWLSNPVPIEGDPIYGNDLQDQEERRMTDLICKFLEFSSSASLRCILHLDAEPLLKAGYKPQHLVRRFSTVKDMLLKYHNQIQIAHDSTPSYLNQMFFDEQVCLYGFKQSHAVGIQRALLQRSRPVVRAEVQQFEEDFFEIHNSNSSKAASLGIDVTNPIWGNEFAISLINEQIENLNSRMTLGTIANTEVDLAGDVILYTHAVEFALQKHREYGQTREDGVTPYGIHILRVVERLRQIGLIDDFEVLTAAAMHDVVEDCEVSLDEIQKKYGNRIAKFVNEVTRQRDQPVDEYISQLQGASKQGKTIKLADRLDNILDLKHFKKDTFGGRSPFEYLEEAKNILLVCRDANLRLSDALDAAIRDTTAVFEELYAERESKINEKRERPPIR